MVGLTGCTSFNVHQEESGVWMGLPAAHLLMSYTKKKAVCGWAYRLHIFQCRTPRRKRCVDGFTGCTSFNVVHQEESGVWMGLPAAHLLMSYTKKKAVCGWAYRLHIFQCRTPRRKRCVVGLTGCTSFNVVHQEESGVWMGLPAAHLLMSYTKKKAVCGWAYRLHIFQCRTPRRKRCVVGLTGCTSFNVVHQEESGVWMGLPAAHLLMSYTKKKAVCGWAYRLHIFQCRTPRRKLSV